MKEQWKLFHDGFYEVSNYGRVRRVARAKGARPGRVLRPRLCSQGYPRAGLYIAGKRTDAKVHRLVANAFLGPCPSGKQVNHKDGVKTNNHAENLEYVTPSENIQHSYRNGLQKTQHSQATIDKTRRLHKTGLSYRAIGRATGMTHGHCWYVVNGRSRVRRHKDE